MKWGHVDLHVKYGTQAVTKRRAKRVRHYPGTDKSDAYDVGRAYTSITLVLIARSDAERLVLESLLHSHEERDFEMDAGYFYKRVVPGESGEFRRDADHTYTANAEFIALDPLPYDSVSGEVLY